MVRRGFTSDTLFNIRRVEHIPSAQFSIWGTVGPLMTAVNAVRSAVFDIWEDRCHYRREGVHEVFQDDH